MPKPSKHGSKQSRVVQLSKAMARLLRHDLENAKIPFDPSGGWVKVVDMLNLSRFRHIDPPATVEDVLHIVDTNSKKRFAVKGDPSDPSSLFVRANQGHSIAAIKTDGLLVPITAENIAQFPICLHGTTLEAWPKIKKSGLNRMSRNHIHMAIGLPEDGNVKSGIRNTSKVIIYIDLSRAIAAGIPFFRSENNVILSPGPILPEFFAKAEQLQAGGTRSCP